MLFSDYGWADTSEAVELDKGFYSVGAGASLLDGLFPIDLGYGLKDHMGFRVNSYLGVILRYSRVGLKRSRGRPATNVPLGTTLTERQVTLDLEWDGFRSG